VARKHWQPPLLKQLTTGDALALGKAAKSRHSEEWTARTKTADRVSTCAGPSRAALTLTAAASATKRILYERLGRGASPTGEPF
jgi:hypothetical protein